MLALVGVAAVTIASIEPPAPVAIDAPVARFSSLRAARVLATVATEPRPPGSRAHAQARARIVSYLQRLGLDAEVQSTIACVDLLARIRCANVQNVLAKLKGQASGRGDVVLAAHYDTVPGSPGANDDGAGVATVLETARALRAGPALKHDVVFLLTDAEEPGLIGATAFMQHPWARDARVVLNFEARGTHGTSAMFNTSAGNAEVIRAFGSVDVHPSSNSLMGLLSDLLPNDTDATVFKRVGIQTMSFAYAEGVEHYHRASDRLSSVDLRSLQHHGEQALALARHLADSDLERLDADEDAVYFDVLGRVLVHYSDTFARWSALCVLALLAWQTTKSGVRFRQVGTALCVSLLAMVAAALATVGLELVVARLVPEPSRLSNGSLFLSGYSALVGSLTLLIFERGSRRVAPIELWTATACGWGVGLLFASIFAPAASFVLMWPLLAGLIGRALHDRSSAARLRNWLTACLCAVPTIFFASYFVYLAHVMSGGSELGAMLMVVWGLSFVVPLLSCAADELRLRWAAWPLAAVAVFVLLFAGFRAANDERVASQGAAADTAPPVGSARAASLTSATRQLESPPEVTTELDETNGARRRVRLRVRSMRPARSLTISEETGATITTEAVAGTRPVASHRFSAETDRRLWTLFTGEALDHWSLSFEAAPPEGFALDLSFPAHAVPSLLVKDVSDSFPEAASPQPPVQGGLPTSCCDETFAYRRYELGRR